MISLFLGVDVANNLPHVGFWVTVVIVGRSLMIFVFTGVAVANLTKETVGDVSTDGGGSNVFVFGSKVSLSSRKIILSASIGKQHVLASRGGTG